MSAASQQPPSLSNTSTLPHPSTPSKQHGPSNPPQGSSTRHRDHPRDGRTTPLQENTTAPRRTAPTTPSQRYNTSNRTLTAPETPKRRRENASKRLPGIKTQLPHNLSLESIRTRLVLVHYPLRLQEFLNAFQVFPSRMAQSSHVKICVTSESS